MFRAIVVLAAVLCATSAWAQWPAHFDRGAPRNADGTVNLDAPTPRTRDGKPDFTGVWVNAWFVNGRVRPLPVSPPGEPPAATFGDVFANFKEPLPLQPWAAQLKAARKEQNSKENPDAHCLPMGLMQFHMHPQPRKVVQTPDVLVILYEGNAGIRQIFTDGRACRRPTRSRGGTATRWAAGTATRWWSRPATSGTAAGSTSTAAR